VEGPQLQNRARSGKAKEESEVNSISKKVLAEATRLADGDAGRAQRWYFETALPEFNGLSASAVVDQGREADLLQLLELYKAGSLG
jgi:hypothetical protein